MLFLPNEEGQGLVEYAMILVSVALLVMLLLFLLGDQVVALFSTITSEVTAVVS